MDEREDGIPGREASRERVNLCPRRYGGPRRRAILFEALNVLTPEEKPQTPQEWINCVRERTLRLMGTRREDWREDEELARIFRSMRRGLSPLKAVLEDEINCVGSLISLCDRYQRAVDSKSLADFAGFPPDFPLLTPEMLARLSDLPSAEIPPYLRNILGREVSMSCLISRAVYLYTAFFGGWAEIIGSGKKQEEQIAELQALSEKVLRGLGFDGVIPQEIIEKILEMAPPEIKKLDPFKKLIEKIKEKEEISLPDIFAKNMFCQGVNHGEVEYTRWWVAMLAGSKYAERIALAFLECTGESGEMNVTLCNETWRGGDQIPRLAFFNESWRRDIEAGKARKSLLSGRFPKGLAHGLLRTARVTINGKEGRIIDFLRDGIPFHKIPWEQLPPDFYDSCFRIPIFNATQVFLKELYDLPNKPLTGEDGLLTAGTWAKLNKKFRGLFGEEWPLARRIQWARDHLENFNLHKLGKDAWPPWFGWALEIVFIHHPEGRRPPRELGETGYFPKTYRFSWGPQKLSGGAVQCQHSLSEVLRMMIDEGFLTQGEAKLVLKIAGAPKGVL